MKFVDLTPDLAFSEAFEIWLKPRVLDHAGVWTNARYISPRTERDLRQYAKEAGRFFGALRLRDIHAGHFRTYQQARAVCDRSVAAWHKPAGANLIRKEVQTVIRVLRAAGLWRGDGPPGFELVQQTDPEEERALTPEEQHRWLHAASSRTEWQIVYWYSLVALQTTAATNEMRGIRLGDVYLEQGTLQIREGKNKHRVRRIPLQTPEVAWALASLIERARDLGASSPHHYLFPAHRGADRYDPERPMSVWGLRKRWDEVREAARLPGFTPYHTRHTALTRMAEAGVPLPVAMSFAGHLSPKMQQRYISISMAAKRGWAQLAFGPPPPPPARPQRGGEERRQREKAAEDVRRAPGSVDLPSWAQTAAKLGGAVPREGERRPSPGRTDHARAAG